MFSKDKVKELADMLRSGVAKDSEEFQNKIKKCELINDFMFSICSHFFGFKK